VTLTDASTPAIAGAAKLRHSWRGAKPWVPWVFLAIPLLFALVFKFIPLIEGIRMSFSKVQPLLGDQFTGFDNFARVLTDSRFHEAFLHTVILAVCQTITAVALGLILALLFEGASRKLQIARTVIFLPVVTAIAVIGEVWRLILQPTDSGLLNTILHWVGISTQQMLSDENSALFWVGLVGVWAAAPYNMLILLAGLVGIDRTLYEAAAVDGAGRWRRLYYIALPGLRASLSVILTLAAIRSLRVFAEVFILTGGGPAGSTEVWMTRIYSIGFDANDLGLASAAALLLLLATMILTVLARWLTNRKGAQL